MRKLARRVAKLRKVIDTDRRNRSTGSLIEVDYFALCDLLRYYDETKEAARATIKARDALEGVFFGEDIKER